MDNVDVLRGPVAGRELARLRDRTTGPESFRRHARAIGALLAAEALGDLPGREGTVETPLRDAVSLEPSVSVVAVPVLRAGLGLLDGVLDLIPLAAIGMVGLERDEDTLEARQYYVKLPPLEDAWVLLLEPMLATGGSASAALDTVAHAGRVVVLSVVATQTGIERIHGDHPDVHIVTAAIDPELDDNGFIVPGLGDFGDRLFGTTS